MPLSMLSMSRDTEVSVLEMGMSGLGEIDFMSRVAEPDIAVITNIGSSHLEMLGSRENICSAKMEIVHGMHPGGKLILNGEVDDIPEQAFLNVGTIEEAIKKGEEMLAAINQ